MNYTHWTTNPRLLRTLIEKSGDIIRWTEKQGVKFEEHVPWFPNQPGPLYRIVGPGKGGANVVKALVKKCQDLSVRMLCQTRAKKLFVSGEGEITGVLAEAKEGEVRITAKSVIIATGGFAGNKELLKKYLPTYCEDDEIHLGGLPHQGDGLLMATEIGAATDGSIILEMSGFVFPWSMHLCVFAKRPDIIWVNKRGERFADETVTFPEFENALFRQPGKIGYTLFDEKIKQSILKEKLGPMDADIIPSGTWPGQVDKEFQAQVKKGRVKISDSWEEIAQWMGSDPKVLQATVDKYNAASDQRHDDIFAKDPKHLLPLRTPPYYAIKCSVNLLVTHGDIKINQYMEVLDKQDNPIPGLYSAGDDIGDVDSDTYNISLPGHSFGFAINSGRIAGESAARFIEGK